MSGPYASLGGVPVTRASVEIPAYGLWAADVMLPQPDAIAPSAKLVIGDLTMQSYAYRTYAYTNSRKSRLVGGLSGGWMQSAPAQQYANPPGLTLSLVLNDLAALIGEKVQITNDQAFGSFFFRKGTGPAKKVLDQLVGPRGWWVDTTGTVQVGATRSAQPITSAFTVNEFDGATGRAVISTETPSDWMPGRTWTAPTVTTTQTVSSVRHAIDESGVLRTEVLSAGPEVDDRLIAPLRDLVESLAPDVTYSGVWEYAVQDTNGTTVSCSPTASSILAAPFPLPQHVTGVTMRPGVAGTSMKPAKGSIVYLAFANGDPSRPVILAYDTTGAQSVGFNAGTGTAEHVMTTEATVNVLLALVTGLAPNFTSPPVTDTVLAAALTAASTQNIGATGPLSTAAMLAALAAKRVAGGDLGGLEPSVGCPNIGGG